MTPGRRRSRCSRSHHDLQGSVPLLCRWVVRYALLETPKQGNLVISAEACWCMPQSQPACMASIELLCGCCVAGWCGGRQPAGSAASAVWLPARARCVRLPLAAAQLQLKRVLCTAVQSAAVMHSRSSRLVSGMLWRTSLPMPGAAHSIVLLGYSSALCQTVEHQLLFERTPSCAVKRQL